jgi:hypothetical protein
MVAFYVAIKIPFDSSLPFNMHKKYVNTLEKPQTLLQPHFGLSVRMKLTLPKVGTWSPPRLPKTQSSSSGVKTPHIEVFFIPLERYGSLDVQNGLA